MCFGVAGYSAVKPIDDFCIKTESTIQRESTGTNETKRNVSLISYSQTRSSVPPKNTLMNLLFKS